MPSPSTSVTSAGERELAVLVRLQRRRRHGVELLLLRAAQAVDAVPRPRSAPSPPAAGGRRVRRSRPAGPTGTPRAGPGRPAARGPGAVRLERDDRDDHLALRRPGGTATARPSVVSPRAVTACWRIRTSRSALDGSPTATAPPRCSSGRAGASTARPIRPPTVAHDDDHGDEHARPPALPPTRAAGHRTSIVSMFQIHCSGLKRSRRRRRTRCASGRPSSIGIAVPSPVRVARKIAGRATSAREVDLVVVEGDQVQARGPVVGAHGDEASRATCPGGRSAASPRARSAHPQRPNGSSSVWSRRSARSPLVRRPAR